MRGQESPSPQEAVTESELRETFDPALPRIVEEIDSPAGDHLMVIECVLGNADKPTKNGRVYTRGLFEKLVAECAAGTPRSGTWLMEADHPESGHARLSATISTPWRNLRIDDQGRLLGETSIIDTSLGEDVQKLIRNGVPVQVSSRTFASLTQEVRDGQTVQIVEESSALEHWGGWDGVLGAAADGAGVTSYREADAPAAVTPPALDVPGNPLDEVLETMDMKELVAQVSEGVKEALKPLMESAKPGESPPAEKAEEKAEAAAPDLTAKVEQAMQAIAALTERVTQKDQAEEKAVLEAATKQALTEAVKAIMEGEELKAWPEAARKLMESSLAEVTSPGALSTTFDRMQRNLTEIGLVVLNGHPAGTGIAGVHVSSSKEKSFADRAKEFQAGKLDPKFLPESPAEVLDLLCEGIPDNGMRSNSDPDDPVRKMLGGNVFFEGYHPGNPRHAFRAVLLNTIKEHEEYLRTNLRGERGPFMKMLEYTSLSGVTAATPFMLPIIRQVWPQLIATQIMSVQPMPSTTGKALYLDFQYDPGGGDPSVPGEFESEYGNNISEQTAIPEVKMVISEADVETDIKKLKADWSTEAAMRLRLDYGLDASSEFVQFMSGEIAREVNAKLINSMRLDTDPKGNITAGNINFGCTAPAAGYTQQEWDREIWLFLLRTNALITATRRRPANWAICGENALMRLQRNETFKLVQQDGAGQNYETGINLVGVIEAAPRLSIYSCASDFFPAESVLLGRKGPDWYDSGAVYCPIVPFYASPVFVDPDDLCQKQAVMSWFGYKKLVGNAFATLTCQAGTTGTPWI